MSDTEKHIKGIFSDFEKLWEESRDQFDQAHKSITELGDKMGAERQSNIQQVVLLQKLVAEATTLVTALTQQVQERQRDEGN